MSDIVYCATLNLLRITHPPTQTTPPQKKEREKKGTQQKERAPAAQHSRAQETQAQGAHPPTPSIRENLGLGSG